MLRYGWAEKKGKYSDVRRNSAKLFVLVVSFAQNVPLSA
jgi:hypothetical protein